MDLIYSNRERQEIGVLKTPELDLAFGSDENDFECTIPLADACCEEGYLIYAEGTEYGGIVDNIGMDTKADTITYSGRTWHGVLGSKCILPLQEGDSSGDGVTLETFGSNNLFKAMEKKTFIPAAGLSTGVYDKTKHTYTLSGTTTQAANVYISNNADPTILNLEEGKTYSLCLQYVSGNVTWSGTHSTPVSIALFSKDMSKFRRTWVSVNEKINKDFAVSFSTSDFAPGTVEFLVVLQIMDTSAVFDNYTFRIQILEASFDGVYSAGTFPPYEPWSATIYNRYLAISGDANRCISYLVNRIGLADLFTVPEEDAGVTISQYQFERYVDAYTGICSMLASAGMRLKIVQEDGAVTLSAVPIVDYSQEKEFESELIPFTTKAYKNKINHLICLGSGELENRLVVHLYADAEGNISQTQTFFGVDDYSAVYDYPNVTAGEDVTEEEQIAELIKSGTERFKELRKPDEIDIDFDIADDAYYIGDIIGTWDSKTNLSVMAAISKKIVTMKNNHVTISYQVG